jgi:DNA-binding NarL/FixJ family response regulator
VPELSVWVDDHHPIFLAGMVAALRAESFRIVGTSESLRQVDLPQACDVLVFDAGTVDRIEASTAFAVPAVAIVQSGAIAEAVAAVQAGVRGLLVRPEVTPRRLGSAVRAAHDGSWTCPSDLAERLLSGNGAADHHPEMLTEREHRVLELLAAGLSTQEIADDMAYSSRTIKNLIQSVLIKLESRNRAQAVGVAVRQGWI